MATDIDAARAARREAIGKGPEVTFGGQTYELATELSLEVMEALGPIVEAQKLGAEGGPEMIRATLGFLRVLLGDEVYAAFRALDPPPTLQDMNVLIGTADTPGILADYGLQNPGESQGSETSSAPTSEPSKRTSKAATG